MFFGRKKKYLLCYDFMVVVIVLRVDIELLWVYDIILWKMILKFLLIFSYERKKMFLNEYFIYCGVGFNGWNIVIKFMW